MSNRHRLNDSCPVYAFGQLIRKKQQQNRSFDFYKLEIDLNEWDKIYILNHCNKVINSDTIINDKISPINVCRFSEWYFVKSILFIIIACLS